MCHKLCTSAKKKWIIEMIKKHLRVLREDSATTKQPADCLTSGFILILASYLLRSPLR